MRMFIIPKGTACLVHKDDPGALNYKTEPHTTKEENSFFREDIVIDPVGELGAHRGLPKTIGGDFAKRGYYGFKRDSWTLIVHMNDVTVV